MWNSATIPTPDASLRRGAVTLAAAGMLDFALQFLLPVALVRLLPPHAFADYRLAWLAVGTAMAVAPFALPRSLFYFLPRSSTAERPAYVHHTFFLLLLGGACAGLVLGPWNALLPRSVRMIEGAAWFMPAFLTLWVAASLAEFLPNARGQLLAQARLIVALALLRVALVAGAAWSGRVDLVFGALLLYAVFKLALVLRDVGRHYGWRVFPLRPQALRAQLVYALPFGLASALFLLRGQADQWVAAALFPALAFAAFSIGATIMPLVALLRNSVGNAIAPRLSSLEAARDQAGMLGLNQRANLACAFVLMPALALCAVLAPHIVTVVYTASYLDAADVMRINCLALLGVAVEVSTLTVVLGQGRYLLVADAVLLPAGLAAAYAGARLWGLPGAALGNVLTLLAGNAYSFWRVARATGVPLRRLQRWGVLLRILAASLGAAIVALLLDRASLLQAPLAEALLAGAAYAVSYVAMLALAGLLPEARALFRSGA
ncbi:MAG: oligosaccharide flippase family protein [Pseudomonadota bacterium]